MFKLVQSSGKAIGGIVTSAIAAGQPLKIIKTVPAAGGQEQPQQQQQQVGALFFFKFLSKIESRFVVGVIDDKKPRGPAWRCCVIVKRCCCAT